MNSLLKNIASYTTANVLNKAVTFLLLPVYTSYLLPEEFGIVNSMQVLSTVLLIFFSLGIERSIYRLFFDYKTEDEQKNFFGTISLSLVLISTIILLILFLGRNYIAQVFKSIPFHPYYSYSILTAYLSLFSLVPRIQLQVKEKAFSYMLISILQLIVNTLFMVWFVIIDKQGAIGMMKSSLYAQFILLPVYLYISYRTINFVLNIEILAKTIVYSVPMIPALLSSWVINLSDRIFIEHYFTQYEVGIYSLGYKIGQLTQFIALAVLMAYNPFYYKNANSENKQNAKITLYKSNNAIVIFYLILSFIIAVFSKDGVILFLNSRYIDAYKFIPIIILGQFFILMVSLQNLSFYQEKKTVLIMYITIISALLNILLNFIFIPKYGIFGAAYSTLITQIVYFIILYHCAKKFFFIPYNWKILGIITFILLLIFGISQYYVTSNWTYFFIKIIVLGIFGFVSYYVFRMKNSLNSYVIKKLKKEFLNII